MVAKLKTPCALKGGYGNGKHGELELMRADGSLVSVHTSINKFELEGQVTFFFIAADLTERRRGEAERTAEFERLVAERTQELKEVN